MTDFSFDSVPDAVASRLRPFLQEIAAFSGESPCAAYLVGPSARDEFSEKNPEIHLLLVYESISIDLLDHLAGLGKTFGRSGIRAPMLLTPDYLGGAQDVFPIELLALKSHYVLLAGKDLLAEVSIGREHLRLETERELRGLRLRMRQGYLFSAGDAGWLSQWMVEKVPDFFTAIRAVLHLNGKKTDFGNTRCAEELRTALDIDAGAFVKVWEDHKAGRKPEKSEVRDLFVKWENALNKLVETVDAL